MLSYGKQISLTEIGRHLNGKAAVKHKIKSVDRFIGNRKINNDIKDICKSICEFLFKGFNELCVLVDWSGCCQKDAHVLQASVAFKGRSIPIYAEVHPLEVTESKSVHDEFLENLSHVIPQNLAITIITDAGFHRDWFSKVIGLGWDFIGRVYSKYQYMLENCADWLKDSELQLESKAKPFKVGNILLGKTKSPLNCWLYTCKQKPSGKSHKKNKYPDHEKAHSSSYRSTWVIASSLDKPAKYLIGYYKKRMQIEQNFRDIKNRDLGLGLRRNKSSGIHRAQVLYFIAMLITVLLWWIGFSCERVGLHRKYQANTIRTHRVISFIKLGRLILTHETNFRIWANFIKSQKDLSNTYVNLMNEAPSCIQK